MTCPKCGKTWSGVTREHCPVPHCHETFNSGTAGDMHRVGDHAVSEGPDRRRCLGPEEMRAKGMVVRGGLWFSVADSRPYVRPQSAEQGLSGIQVTPHPETPGNL